MDPKMTEVTQMFARFKAAYARNDLNTCVTLLSQLKVHLTQFPSLPPLFQQTPNIVEELKLAKSQICSKLFLTYVFVLMTKLSSDLVAEKIKRSLNCYAVLLVTLPSTEQVLNSAQNISGDIYEHAVVLSVKLEDQDAFERDFCQLKPYYMDT
ncbi:26S proteasome non-ATPase regulatory subunit 8 homolog A [Zea mays]|nr:26S proteasome non-ATPase regulatory subunit 8 homolog A [Zea mays]